MKGAKCSLTASNIGTHCFNLTANPVKKYCPLCSGLLSIRDSRVIEEDMVADLEEVKT